MRRKAQLEKALTRARSDLVRARLVGDWNGGLVNYLLGQVVTLEIVLKADLDWATAYNVTKEQIDRSVADIKDREAKSDDKQV